MTRPPRCAGCGRPVNGTTLCRLCVVRLEHGLVSIATFAPELDTAIARQAVFGERAGGGHAVEVPLPFDERAAEAQWVIRSTLAAWCDELQTPADTAPEREPAPMAVWLLAHAKRIAVMPDAGLCLDEIADVAHQATRVIDRPPELLYAGPCGDCRRPLYVKAGRETVTCRDHDPEWTGEVAARREWMLSRAADIRTHAAGAVRLLAVLEIRVSAVQITRWQQAGALVGRGLDERGRTLHRLGDLIELATRKERDPE